MLNKKELEANRRLFQAFAAINFLPLQFDLSTGRVGSFKMPSLLCLACLWRRYPCQKCLKCPLVSFSENARHLRHLLGIFPAFWAFCNSPLVNFLSERHLWIISDGEKMRDTRGKDWVQNAWRFWQAFKAFTRHFGHLMTFCSFMPAINTWFLKMPLVPWMPKMPHNIYAWHARAFWAGIMPGMPWHDGICQPWFYNNVSCLSSELCCKMFFQGRNRPHS